MKRLIDGDRLMEPRININGMTREQHIRNRINVMVKALDLMGAMTDLRPHGRDYIGDADAYERDMAIYIERYAAIDKLRNELEDEALAIQEGER